MTWHPVRLVTLERAAQEIRERRQRADAAEVPPLDPEVQDQLRRADQVLSDYIASDEWNHLLGLGADVHSEPVANLRLPTFFVNYFTGEAAFAWTVTRSRQCAEVLIEVGPVVTVTQLSNSMFGPARRVLAASRTLAGVAEALGRDDRNIGVAALLALARAILNGHLGDLVRENLWAAARLAFEQS